MHHGLGGMDAPGSLTVGPVTTWLVSIGPINT